LAEDSPLSKDSRQSRLSQSAAGRQPLPRKFVENHQRQRVAIAIAEIAHERGVGELTATRIVRGARMSRNTFYELFGSKEESLRYAFQEAFEYLFGSVRRVNEVNGPWLDRLQASLDAFFAAIVEDPVLAELCLVHSFGAAVEAEGFDYEAGVGTMIDVMNGGREAGKAAATDGHTEPPPQVEEFLARSIVSLAATRVRKGEAERLPEHRDELVRLAATPFFGSEELVLLDPDPEAV
jgi:AcrR family transcriptional regulator